MRVYVRSYAGATVSREGHRMWHVSLCVDDEVPVLKGLRDPLKRGEYDLFERYLSREQREEQREDGGFRMKGRMLAYAGGVLRQLEICELEEDVLDRPGLSSQRSVGDERNGREGYDEEHLNRLTLHDERNGEHDEELLDQHNLVRHEEEAEEVQIYIVQVHRGQMEGGVHCLAWELLEMLQVPGWRFRVTRVSDFGEPARTPRGGGVYHVLLVVARDFTRTDPEPDLAQWPLMSVHKRLRGRMMLEVVRPGSLEELGRHLRALAAVGRRFDLVHFDVHGRIVRDEPWLLFAGPGPAQRHDMTAGGGCEHQVPQTRLAKAKDVAQLLARYGVDNVVLNACLSAYNRTEAGTNMAHIFLAHGVDNVSAMSFYVHWQTIATYLGAFYDELLLRRGRFHEAAQRGREAVRRSWTRACHDFFICVSYARNEPPAFGGNRHERMMVGEDWSVKNKHWYQHEVMRLKLHLLELEYKLTTARVVYASDLRRDGSDMDDTLERMVDMWLATRLVGEVSHHKAKEFASRSRLNALLHHRRRKWSKTLYVVRGIDAVVDPGYQADEREDRRGEGRRMRAQEGLQRFAQRLHREGPSYMLLLGRQDAQWWAAHLRHLGGQWWVHMPWQSRQQ